MFAHVPPHCMEGMSSPMLEHMPPEAWRDDGPMMHFMPQCMGGMGPSIWSICHQRYGRYGANHGNMPPECGRYGPMHEYMPPHCMEGMSPPMFEHMPPECMGFDGPMMHICLRLHGRHGTNARGTHATRSHGGHAMPPEAYAGPEPG